MQGNYYPANFKILGVGNTPVAEVSVSVRVVDSIACQPHSRRCTPVAHATNVAQMGVGFGQEAANQPDGVPARNPFLNIISTPRGVLPSKGYMISQTGVTLGLQASALNGFSLVKLSPYPGLSTAGSPEWLLAPATVSVNHTAAEGVILSDTGVTEMFLTVPSGANVSTFTSSTLPCGDSCAREGTSVVVNLPGQVLSALAPRYRLSNWRWHGSRLRGL